VVASVGVMAYLDRDGTHGASMAARRRWCTMASHIHGRIYKYKSAVEASGGEPVLATPVAVWTIARAQCSNLLRFLKDNKNHGCPTLSYS